MGNKTVYIQDEGLWHRAKELAGKAGLSGVIARALEEFVDRGDRESQGFRRYQFELRYEDDEGGLDATDYVAFEGKRLFEGVLFYQLSEGVEVGPPDDRVQVEVYQTAKGTLVLIARHLEAPHGQIFQQGSYKSMRDLLHDSVVSNLAPDDRAKLLADLSSQLRKTLVVWIE